MARKDERNPLRIDHSAYRHCIFAVRRNDDGAYWYDPQHKMFFRGFNDAGTRDRFWKSIVIPRSAPRPGLVYELALVELWGRTATEWRRIAPPRYSDSPIIDAHIDHSGLVGGLIDCSSNTGLE